MKPVDQAIVSSGKGDCFSACMASILELPLEEVPKFVWHFQELSEESIAIWLARRGYAYLKIGRPPNACWAEEDYWGTWAFGLWWVRDTYCIISGKSPNIDGVNHAVVGHIDQHRQITVAHDPSPFKRGIKGAPTYLTFMAAQHPHILQRPKIQQPFPEPLFC